MDYNDTEKLVTSFFQSITARTAGFNTGTVGLSTGITSELSEAGRAIIMLNMFIGRIGPLALASPNLNSVCQCNGS